MSKYGEALEDIKNKKVITCEVCDERMHRGCLCCQNTYTTSDQISILKEAVDKAEKLDNIDKELGCPIEVVMEAFKEFTIKLENEVINNERK